MITCPECGKELKHRGALNGHLAFAHGVWTQKALTLDELRSEVQKLRSELDYLYRFFKSFEYKDHNGNKNSYLIAKCTVSGGQIKLRAMPENSWIGENGGLVIEAEVEVIEE